MPGVGVTVVVVVVVVDLLPSFVVVVVIVSMFRCLSRTVSYVEVMNKWMARGQDRIR